MPQFTSVAFSYSTSARVPLILPLRFLLSYLILLSGILLISPSAHSDPGDILDLDEVTRTLPFVTSEAQFRETMDDLYSIINFYEPKNLEAEGKEVTHVNHSDGKVRFSFIGTKTVLGVSMRARFISYVSSNPTPCSEAIEGEPVTPSGYLVRQRLNESDSLVTRNVSDLYGEVCFSQSSSQKPLKVRLRTYRVEGSGYQLINGGVLDKVLKEQAKPLLDAVLKTAESHPHG